MPQIPPVQDLFSFLRENAAAIGPQLQLILWGLGLLCVDFLLPAERKSRGALYALGGLVMASLHVFWLWGASPGPAFYSMVTLDSFSLFFDFLFLATGFLVVLMSYRYLEIESEQHTEYYALLLFAISGMMFLAAAVDLVTIFVGLELMSISIYILVGFLRGRRRSNEASMKYFLLGAFSTGVILYGMSLLYGLSGSTNLRVISRQLLTLEGNPLLALALFLVLAGLCFKVAAVPFHMWAPDAYEGAPTAVTAFMSVAVKAAAFAVFFRIFLELFSSFRSIWVPVLALVSMVTMTWGNVAAMRQRNVKRLLAYSSIAHAGYVLMGLVAGTRLGVQAAAVYLLAYTFMNLGAWAVLILLRRQDIAGEEVEDFNGLFFKAPWVGALMLLFFLSLAGIPPLSGFIAKYFVFAAVVDLALKGGPEASLMVWLAVVGALNAVVALFYYFRVVVAIFMERRPVEAPLGLSTGLVVVLVLTILFTVVMGIYPQPFIQLAQSAALPLG